MRQAIVIGGLAVFLVFLRAALKRFWRNRVDPIVADVSSAFETADDKAGEQLAQARTRFRGRRERFREWCERYFYLKHRGEHRGVGGIFFDNLVIDPSEPGHEERLLGFIRDGVALPELVFKCLPFLFPLLDRAFVSGFDGSFGEYAGWLWGGPTVCQRCVDADAVKIALEWKAEADRLRKLFDDAGEGQYNVLNLVESYQRNSMEADERLRAVRKLLEENGCECPCDHHPDERGDDCEVCLACRIGEAVGK